MRHEIIRFLKNLFLTSTNATLAIFIVGGFNYIQRIDSTNIMMAISKLLKIYFNHIEILIVVLIISTIFSISVLEKSKNKLKNHMFLFLFILVIGGVGSLFL